MADGVLLEVVSGSGILTRNNGDVAVLNYTAEFYLRELAAGRSKQETANLAVRRYAVEFEQAMKDMARLIDDLNKHGYLEVD